jgi:hypothetical protein
MNACATSHRKRRKARDEDARKKSIKIQEALDDAV